MNVYLLTNTRSGAQALVFARVEHEARNRRPDGAVWRLGRWIDPGTSRMAGVLEWWPGSPLDVCVEAVLERIDADAAASSLPAVLAVKTLPFPPGSARGPAGNGNVVPPRDT